MRNNFTFQCTKKSTHFETFNLYAIYHIIDKSVLYYFRLVSLDLRGVPERCEGMEEEYSVALPDPCYKDLHGGLVFSDLPMKIIQAYDSSNNKTFDNKFKEMYQQR